MTEVVAGAEAHNVRAVPNQADVAVEHHDELPADRILAGNGAPTGHRSLRAEPSIGTRPRPPCIRRTTQRPRRTGRGTRDLDMAFPLRDRRRAQYTSC